MTQQAFKPGLSMRSHVSDWNQEQLIWTAPGGGRCVSDMATAMTDGGTSLLYTVDLPHNQIIAIDVMALARDRLIATNGARFNVSQTLQRFNPTDAPVALGGNVSTSPVGTNGGAPPAGYSVAITLTGYRALITVTGPTGPVDWLGFIQVVSR